MFKIEPITQDPTDALSRNCNSCNKEFAIGYKITYGIMMPVIAFICKECYLKSVKNNSEGGIIKHGNI